MKMGWKQNEHEMKMEMKWTEVKMELTWKWNELNQIKDRKHEWGVNEWRKKGMNEWVDHWKNEGMIFKSRSKRELEIACLNEIELSLEVPWAFYRRLSRLRPATAETQTAETHTERNTRICAGCCCSMVSPAKFTPSALGTVTFIYCFHLATTWWCGWHNGFKTKHDHSPGNRKFA